LLTTCNSGEEGLVKLITCSEVVNWGQIEKWEFFAGQSVLG